MKKLLKSAIIQQPSVFMNLAESTEKALGYIKEASEQHAELIVFPETWLPGYPVWLDYAPNAGLWDHPPAKKLFRILTENAIRIGDEYFQKFQQAASESKATVVIGAHEKAGRTLYNTMFYFLCDGGCKYHRKLMPTYTERLIWGQGDGSSLSSIEHNSVSIGGLICWEHWMPLARAAMHSLGEDIHIAQWPMLKELNLVASRHYAFEAQCFVIAAGSTLTKRQMLQGLNSVITTKEDELALELIESIDWEPDAFLLNGGSAVIKPNGDYLQKPVYEEPTIIYSDLNLEELSEGSLFLDADGHYSRPDVFQLKVNTDKKENVEFGGIDRDD